MQAAPQSRGSSGWSCENDMLIREELDHILLLFQKVSFGSILEAAKTHSEGKLSITTSTRNFTRTEIPFLSTHKYASRPKILCTSRTLRLHTVCPLITTPNNPHLPPHRHTHRHSSPLSSLLPSRCVVRSMK